jgi:WD40 repeat protein
MSASWSRDGDQLATAGWDGVLRVWNPVTGELLAQISGGTTQFLSVAFTPDGLGLVAGAHDGAVTVWDIATGRQSLVFDGHSKSVTWVGYSPDGELLATTSDDHSARIWDPRTGKQLASFAHPDSVMDGTWSEAGDALVTFCVDSQVRIWPIDRVTDDVEQVSTWAAQYVPWTLVDGQLVRRAAP